MMMPRDRNIDHNSRRRSRETGTTRKSFSNSKPVGSARVGTSSIPEGALIDQNVLKSIPVADLLSGFEEVKQKISKTWTSFDNTMSGQAILDNLNTINLAVRTLQEIAGAVMASDPHTAVYSQVLEDMWLFGFTRPSNICVKFEQSQHARADQVILNNIRSWRRDFLTNWTGFLYKLQDSFQIFRNPDKMLRLMPHQTYKMLPSKHPILSQVTSDDEDKSTAELKKRLYELPLTYLLRDIALCLARTCGHENRELERVWIERAYRINSSIAGSRYKDAWARLNDQLQNATKADSPQNSKTSYPVFDYSKDFVTNQISEQMVEPHLDLDERGATSTQSNDEMETTLGKLDLDFSSQSLNNNEGDLFVKEDEDVAEVSRPKLPASYRVAPEEEQAELNFFAIEALERASGRNAFIQGLLERAADGKQGSSDTNEKAARVN